MSDVTDLREYVKIEVGALQEENHELKKEVADLKEDLRLARHYLHELAIAGKHTGILNGLKEELPIYWRGEE
jgi:cell division septum initiation protein DivIVA